MLLMHTSKIFWHFFDSRDPPPAGLGMTGFATTALRFYALQKAIVEGLSTTIASILIREGCVKFFV